MRMNITILLATVSLLFLFSCEDDLNRMDSKNVTIEGFELLENDIYSLVELESDPEIVNINKVALDLSYQLMSNSLNTDMINEIYKSAKQMKVNSAFFGETVRRSISARSTNVDQLLFRAESMMYNGENYQATIHIPNLDNADLDLEPIISPAYEIDDTTDSTCIDCIAGFIKDNSTNKWKEILLSEEQAMRSKRPIMVISQVNDYTKEIMKERRLLPSKLDNDLEEERNRAAVTTYYTGNFIINKRHEASGRSEVAIAVYSWSPTTGYGGVETKIAEVEKKNIGRVQGSSARFVDTRFTDGAAFTGFNMFERDWYHSSQPLGEVTESGRTLHLSGKARFSSNFYIYSPFSGVIPPFDADYVHQNGSITYYKNNYGKLLVKR